jgi:5-(carboxyamino)imidazole ribonucleotide mutase
MGKPVVSIIMGSQSDLEQIRPCLQVCEEFKLPYELRILSAHRSPERLISYVKTARAKGIKIFIAAAGGAAALAGVVAAHTTSPVIGVPIETKSLKGIDSLLSTMQMPGGVPVACMAIGKAGAKNAAIFALQILALNDKKIANRLLIFKRKLTGSVKTKI